MTDSALVILGALVGALSSLVTTMWIEHWKLKRASRAAASLILHELEEHQEMLHAAVYAEGIPGAQYRILFSFAAWKSVHSLLLPGASAADSAALMYWYSFLESKGFVLVLGPGGGEAEEGLGMFKAERLKAFASARDAALRTASVSLSEWQERMDRRARANMESAAERSA